MSRFAVLPVLPLLTLVAACGTQITDGSNADPARVRRTSEAIVNGTPSPATDNAVVYIAVNGNSGEFCTGTLITPNLVITARHCVSELDETVECGAYTTQMQPSSLGISVGIDPGSITAHATKIFIDTARGSSSCGNDMALFQLDQDVPGAMIAKVRFTPLTVGEVARTAGYGDSGNGTPTNGRYQKTGIKVDSVGPASYTYKDKQGRSYPVSIPVGEIITGESTCFGDSGGPLFDGMGNVIGMTSRGIDEKCIDRPSIYSDTASHAQFIKDSAATAGHPLVDAATPPATPPASTSRPTPSGPASTSTSSGGDDDSSLGSDDSDDDTTKKKSSRGALAQTSGGCAIISSGPGKSTSDSRGPGMIAMIGLALGAVIARRRR